MHRSSANDFAAHGYHGCLFLPWPSSESDPPQSDPELVDCFAARFCLPFCVWVEKYCRAAIQPDPAEGAKLRFKDETEARFLANQATACLTQVII